MSNDLSMSALHRLIDLLEITEIEAIKALISAFSPCQPGALYGTWKKRVGYAVPESTQLIWEIFEDADFRCTAPGCRSQLRITLDHIDKNPLNSHRDNLQVLCHNCNRARVGAPITKDLSARVVQAVFELIDRCERFPTNIEIAKEIGIPPAQLGGTIYSIRMLKKRYHEHKFRSASIGRDS